MSISRRTLSRAAGSLLREAAVHLFPSRCFACERPLPRAQLLGACAVCWASLAEGARPWCPRCAIPLPTGVRDDGPARGCCSRCAVRPPPFDRAVAAVVYGDRARRFLLRAKSGHRPELFRPFAGQLAAAATVHGVVRGIDAVVPVPSTRLARWRRGFEPAKELSRELARILSLPLRDDVLRKRGLFGPASKSLSAPARFAGAESTVAARRTVPGERILLVDDVLTTGATASACARVLRASGAVEIRVAVWARTPSPGRRL